MTRNRSNSRVDVQLIAMTLLKTLCRCLYTSRGSVITRNDRSNPPVTGPRKLGLAGQDAGRAESGPDFDPSDELDPTRPIRL